jgi:LysM repeat protein
MKSLWQVLRGIFIAMASLLLILGGLSLSMAESKMNNAPVPSDTVLVLPTSTFTLRPTFTSTPSSTLGLETPTDTETPTPTLPPPPTNCPPPAGWVGIIVNSGETLPVLATRYRSSVTALRQANCLLTDVLTPGAILYVPPLPTNTRIPCGPPSGWTLMIVQPGDTLYRLSQAFGVTVPELQRANCMGSSTLLHVGQSLYVPPWATRTPSPTLEGFPPSTYVPTDTFFETFTETPTDTSPFIPSETPTDTPTS